jgi:hypothetical protein
MGTDTNLSINCWADLKNVYDSYIERAQNLLPEDD